MKKLIINADDFGLHPLINKGIIEGTKRHDYKHVDYAGSSLF